MFCSIQNVRIACAFCLISLPQSFEKLLWMRLIVTEHVQRLTSTTANNNTTATSTISYPGKWVDGRERVEIMKPQEACVRNTLNAIITI